MKKKIFVNIVLALELVMFSIYIASYFTNALDNIIPFNYIILAGGWCHEKLDLLANLIRLPDLFNMLFGTNLHFICVLVSLLVFNIAWIVVFYVIFCIIGAIIKKHNLKNIRKLVPEYKLTPSEEKKFLPKKYKKKAIRWIIPTFIIPVLFIATFILARFDEIYVPEVLINSNISWNIYSKFVLPVYNAILNPLDFNNIFRVLFTNNANIGYFDLVNKFLVEVPWVEFIILGLGTIILLAVWFGLFILIALIFRGLACKLYSKKAKKAYIEKMEKLEYKLRRKYKDDSIAKGDEFLRIIEEEQNEDAKEIAKIKEEKSPRHLKKIDARKKAYLEEIGYGVTDLGISEQETIDEKEPIVEREIRYISDEDVDIILDEEPVIEIVEEDDMEAVELANKEDDLFFEKYQEDDVDLELVDENKPEPEDVMDYVKDKAEDKETPVVELPEEKEEEPVFEEYEEEPSIPEIEEPVEEPLEKDEYEEKPVPEQEVNEAPAKEEPKKNDPFAAYRNRVNKGHGAKKVQTFKDAGFKDDEMMVRDDGVKVSIKFDPFAKWRNAERKKGYGAKKVPSFKELQQIKEKEQKKVPVTNKKQAPKAFAKKKEPKKEVPTKVEPTPVEPQKVEEPKKNDPFAAFRNKPRTSSGSKKVPPRNK